MKKKMSILGALLLAVVVTGYSVSGTYAKYTTTFTGTSDSATVGTWNVSANDVTATGTTQAFTFDIFDDTTQTAIAPGDSGSGTITLKNLSNVDATYNGTITLNNGGTPVEISLQGGDSATDWSTSTLTVAADDLAKSADGTTATEATITIYWRWAGTDNDADTAAGIAAATAGTLPTVSASASITVSQKTA